MAKKRKRKKPRFDRPQISTHSSTSAVDERREMAKKMIDEAESWLVVVMYGYDGDQPIGDSSMTIGLENPATPGFFMGGLAEAMDYLGLLTMKGKLDG